MPRRKSSIVAATCPRCDGSLHLTEDHDRFFTCDSCGTSLEDTAHGRGSPQTVTVTVAGARSKPLSSRAKVGMIVGAAAVVVGLAALAASDSDDDEDRDRITLGTVVDGDDGVHVLATGTTFDGVVRAVSTRLDGSPGWSVDVADQTSAQTRAAVGDETIYLLLERELVGLSTDDGTERFRVDLPNDLACPDCLVASGDRGQYLTVSLHGGTVATYAGADGSLVSEVDVGAGSYWLVVTGDTVAFATDHAADVAVADPADLPGATRLGLECPDPIEFGDQPEREIDELGLSGHEGDLIVRFDECLARWSASPSTEIWRQTGISPLSGFAPDPSPDLVLWRGGDDPYAVVDLADGSVHGIDIEPTSVEVLSRAQGATTAVVQEDGVASIVAFDQTTGAVRWRKTPPGDFERSFLPGVLQQFSQGLGATWVAGSGGSGGSVVHRVQHDADRDAVGLQQIDLVTGDATDEVSVSYAEEGATGVRLPVVLGYTDVGVVLTLDDRITHLDSATGEVLAEA